MHTDSLFSALAEKDLYQGTRDEKRHQWMLLRSVVKNAMTRSLQVLATASLLAPAELNIKNKMKVILECSRKTFDAFKCRACATKRSAVTTV